jgi:hypothetical protein
MAQTWERPRRTISLDGAKVLLRNVGILLSKLRKNKSDLTAKIAALNAKAGPIATELTEGAFGEGEVLLAFWQHGGAELASGKTLELPHVGTISAISSTRTTIPDMDALISFLREDGKGNLVRTVEDVLVTTITADKSLLEKLIEKRLVEQDTGDRLHFKPINADDHLEFDERDESPWSIVANEKKRKPSKAKPKTEDGTP